MNSKICRLLMLTMAATATVSLGVSAQTRDNAEIRRVAMRQADTWNSHDAKAYAALFTEDCDVVNVLGWWWQGRPELEGQLTTAFSSVFRDSRLTITDVRVRSLAPTVALAHARWSMVGAKMPPGMPEPREGIQTLVFTKQAGHWLIAGFQNTNSVPERPLPPGSGPPTAPKP